MIMRPIIISVLWLLMPTITLAADESVILQSTTSTQNSGLYDYLLPLIERDTGVKVYVVAVGTGQAITNARNCDGDLLLVHSRTDEERFVADKYGLYRENLMYNDFVIIGPEEDSAMIADAITVDDALARIADNDVIFVSRGDDSGTHKAELRLWQRIDMEPDTLAYYRETGSGMGATLS
ncbi:MAG: substrate-binding domain-containing protein, partial [Candidatus Puniceispirillales bacterium]